MKLNVLSTGLALGIVWAIGILLTGWFSTMGWGNMFVETMSSAYIGYSSSFFGGIIGAIWAFVDAGIGGLLFAFFYNLILGQQKTSRR